MPRKRKAAAAVGIGLSAKQMRRKKPISSDYLVDIVPITENQEKFFDAYKKGKHIFTYGAAGTGKTFITLYNALKEVLDDSTPYQKIYMVRSLVSTREIGFLPGDHEDKSALYQIPYKNMVKYMFEMSTCLVGSEMCIRDRVFYLVTTKIKLIFTRYHIRIWLSICFKCQLMLTCLLYTSDAADDW